MLDTCLILIFTVLSYPLWNIGAKSKICLFDLFLYFIIHNFTRILSQQVYKKILLIIYLCALLQMLKWKTQFYFGLLNSVVSLTKTKPFFSLQKTVLYFKKTNCNVNKHHSMASHVNKQQTLAVVWLMKILSTHFNLHYL